MDETAFRQACSDAVARPCIFQKALLAHCVDCKRADRVQIAEREAVGCRNPASHARCVSLHHQLKLNFSFALGIRHINGSLSHAQELRVQCGGLMGLHFALSGSADVNDVDSLLGDALERWGDLERIPYSEVVYAAGLCYKGRRG